ncbi:MAG: DUF4126 domain-containing protein [gamma proteobacterium symbiont of Bathyaustriella thionipta]|nr:DUF4126 domain-containing protein [gamma proteobacterium symbiont of Bathyaustriella thionipta]MCU7950213.1 DUF4126 domain-containing protein [gamma proteobacterium symbiont of Bathyaustriella thionipta]MCU7952043.1 DUF4126 domain-containing protein [gamma proteobacterium symbiont of Bathyaustriella thionipta]MCU7956845.1 DUF4126 domain-containing protein [gamma proteobacterium symbiont of Bathyaustriella thionipta]MCU7967174.1 DUF4126 domain-containing protein [gamma proteobacterium symbion
MEEYNQIVTVIAMSMGIAWASGINLYAAILMLGLMGSTGNIDLPPDLQVLSDPMVIGAAGIMYCVEFFADKVPGVDTGWDAMHTFIRVPAGAMLAAGAVGDVSSAAGIAAGILGGGMALTTHSFKAGSRVLINTSPEPVTNWTASISEDIAVFAGLWAALNHPALFVLFMFLFIILMIWLLPKLWTGIKSVFKALGRFFSGKQINNSGSFEMHNEQTSINDSALKMDYKKKD